MLAQKCTGAFIICHNMSIKGARKRPDMRILCRIARGSEASRNPLESLQTRTNAGRIARGSEASRNPSYYTPNDVLGPICGKITSKSPQFIVFYS